MTDGRPCDFDGIAPGTEDRTPCSPEVDEGFRGIKIHAPQEVLFGPDTRDSLFGGFARIVVSGACQLPYPALGLRGRWNSAILLIAIDTRDRQVYAGIQKPFGSPAPPLDPLDGTGLTPEDFADTVACEWFDANLATVLHLPEREAEYDVHATLGPYNSNVVHIKVRRKR